MAYDSDQATYFDSTYDDWQYLQIELETLPEILANGKRNLRRPAQVWTENAIYQAYYAKLLLREQVGDVCTDVAELKRELLGAAEVAYDAVHDFETWLRDVLLPRSTRSPAWKVEEIEHYQFVHEQLTDYGVDEMIAIAEREEAELLREMEELARRIHPAGDLRTVWGLMKDEAPPWSEVIPMAQLKGSQPGSRKLLWVGYGDGGRKPPAADSRFPTAVGSRQTANFGS